MTEQTSLDAVRQNLKDAGCEEAFIDRFFLTLENRRSKEAVQQLRCRRNELLDEIHCSQHKLDCLDYLIRKLESQNG